MMSHPKKEARSTPMDRDSQSTGASHGEEERPPPRKAIMGGIKIDLPITRLPAWTQKASEQVKDLPETLVGLRQVNRKQERDPLPFTYVTENGNIKILIPEQLPEDPDIQLFAGTYLEIAKMANFKISVTSKALEASQITTMKALKNTFIGAFYCLRQDEIVPQENVVPEYSSGYNFALWYAFSWQTKVTDQADYLKIRKVTSLIPSTKSAWGTPGASSFLLQLSAFVRAAAHARKARLGNALKFLKGEGYFIEKFAGKKPMSGLYTDSEYAMMIRHYQRRTNEIKSNYKELDFHLGGSPEKEFIQRITRFNSPLEQEIKNIEESKNSRVPYLVMVTRQRGKSQQNIAKGSTLAEKLRSIEGGAGLRTIGNVLYSPLCGVNRTAFVGACIAHAKTLMSQEENSSEKLERLVEQLQPQSQFARAETINLVLLAANVYQETFPAHFNDPPWQQTFAKVNPVVKGSDRA
jgi:hypothetical protein